MSDPTVGRVTSFEGTVGYIFVKGRLGTAKPARAFNRHVKGRPSSACFATVQGCATTRRDFGKIARRYEKTGQNDLAAPLMAGARLWTMYQEATSSTTPSDTAK